MENFRRCRICITDSGEMMSIFGDNALWKKITSFANVQIDEGDDLPQQICVHCARNVINACSFKEKCEEADRFFRVSTGHPAMENDAVGYSTDALSHDEADHLHLIPEIEIITPNDDDKTEASGHQCSICFDFFAMKSILNHHMKTKHPDACPSYECFECKKSYISKRFLDKHVRRGRCNQKPITQGRKVQCTECHTTFPSGHHLGWHKRAGTCPSRQAGTSFVPILLDPDDTDSETGNLNDSFTNNTEITSTSSRAVPKPLGKRWNGKRKGRTRMKLNTYKIELAKRLMREDATTTRLAQELGISRTYAWKLRKSLDAATQSPNFPSPKRDAELEPNVPIHSAERQQSVITINNNNNKSKDEINQSTDQYLETKPGQENGQIKVKEENDSEDDGEKTKSADESHENGQSHIQDNQESEEDDDNRSDDEDGEETESADETGSLVRYPVPSCSNSSFSLGSVDVTPSDSVVAQNVAPELNPQGPPYRRKPRKPNVFLTQEMYDKAKILVANRATTMEVARNLNISQMSAWKLRDNIIKGIPMTFKPPPSPRLKDAIPKINMPREKMRMGLRQERDMLIKREILRMIKEDNNIQYWKISERLAEQGLYLSASSVCQKLKAMGFHRRWKPSDSLRYESPMKSMSGGEDYNS